MFVDERKDKLSAIEDKAKRELGLVSSETYDPKRLRGIFMSNSKQLYRWKKGRVSRNKTVFFGFSFLAIVILLVLWHYLSTGFWQF